MHLELWFQSVFIRAFESCGASVHAYYENDAPVGIFVDSDAAALLHRLPVAGGSFAASQK